MKYYFVIVIITLLTVVEDCQAQLEKSLLWRISGNELKEPSYLFGTVHLSYEKYFEIGDSTFLALNSCKQFASEVNIDSMWYYYATLLTDDDDYDEYQKIDIKKYFTKDELDEINKRLFENANIKIENIDAITLIKFLELLSNTKKVDVKSATFIDAHLFRIAKCLGKDLNSLENQKDITKTVANLKNYDNNFKNTEEEFVRLIKDGMKDSTINMISNMYLEADIDGMYQYFSNLSQYYFNAIVVDRNLSFVERIKALMSQNSTFIAVGAGHLGGEKGMVNLLREQGYKVEAVQKKVSNISKNFKYDCKNVQWVLNKNESSGIQFELPFSISKEGNKMHEKQSFIDFGTGITYSIISYKSEEKNIDSIKHELENVVESMAQFWPNSELKSKTEINGDTFWGYDAEYWIADQYLRNWVVFSNEMIHVLNAGTFILNHDNYDIKRFFSSIKFFDREEPQKIEYTSPDSSFTATFSGMPNINEYKSVDDNGFDRVIQYNYQDFLKKNNMIILESRFAPGYNFQNREVLDEIAETIVNDYISDPYIKRRKPSIKNGLFTYEISGISAGSTEFFKIEMIVAFDRFYILCGINFSNEDMTEIDNFINSFSINFKSNKLTQNYYKDNFQFSLPAINSIDENIVSIDSTEFLDDDDESYTFADKISGINWTVYKSEFNEFYQAESDSSEILEIVKPFGLPIDSLDYFNITQNGNIKYFDYKWTTNDSLGIVCIGKLLLVGREYLNLFALGIEPMFEVNDVQKHLQSIKYTGQSEGWSLQVEKKELIIQHLKSDNDEKKKTIKEVLYSTEFDKSYFKELSQVLLMSHYDDNEYNPLRNQIMGILYELDSIGFKKLVIKNYDKIAISPNIEFEIISLLSSLNDEDALEFAMRKFTKINTDSIGEYSLFYFFYGLLNNDYTFENHLKDLVAFYQNERFTGMIASIFTNAIETEKIAPKILKKYENVIIESSLNYITNNEIMQEDHFEYGDVLPYESITELMFYLSNDNSTKQYFDKLFEFIEISNLNIYKAIYRIKFDLLVSDDDIYNIALDKSKCSKFLKLLKVINRTDKFPQELSTAQHLSKSLIQYNFFENPGNETDHIEFLGEVKVEIENETSKYLFYKHEDRFIYLFWVGPFSLEKNPKSILSSKIEYYSTIERGEVDYSVGKLKEYILNEDNDE